MDFQAVVFLDPLVLLGEQVFLESSAVLDRLVTLGKEDHLAPLDPQDPVERLAFKMEIHCVPMPVHQVVQDTPAYLA